MTTTKTAPSPQGSRSSAQIAALFVVLILSIILLFANFAYLNTQANYDKQYICLLYTSPSPRDRTRSRMPSSA